MVQVGFARQDNVAICPYQGEQSAASKTGVSGG